MIRSRRAVSGFTVIELVLAVAILVVLTAMAMPRLLGARKKAAEASAIGSIKAIQAAESIYQTAYPAIGYSPSLIYLGNNGSTCETTSPTNACLLDAALANGTKDDYIFDLLGDGKTPDQSYSVTANPVSSASGECTFTGDQSGSLQASYGAPPQGRAAGVSGGAAGSCGNN